MFCFQHPFQGLTNFLPFSGHVLFTANPMKKERLCVTTNITEKILKVTCTIKSRCWLFIKTVQFIIKVNIVD